MITVLTTLLPYLTSLIDGPSGWYTAAAVVIIGWLFIRFIFKKIKWLIIIALVLILAGIAYGKLFFATANYLPQTPAIIKGADSINVLRLFIPARLR